MFFFHLDGKKTSFWTKLSRNAREIRVDEIRANARSVGVKGEDLFKILSCDHDASRTRQIVEQAITE